MKTIADEPDRLKYCNHCEREKPAREFHANRAGYPQGRCKVCHNYFAKLSFRRRYRKDSAFAELHRVRSRTRYHGRAVIV